MKERRTPADEIARELRDLDAAIQRTDRDQQAARMRNRRTLSQRSPPAR